MRKGRTQQYAYILKMYGRGKRTEKLQNFGISYLVVHSCLH